MTGHASLLDYAVRRLLRDRRGGRIPAAQLRLTRLALLVCDSRQPTNATCGSREEVRASIPLPAGANDSAIGSWISRDGVRQTVDDCLAALGQRVGVDAHEHVGAVAENVRDRP
jgi:hypothetical protein